MADHALDDATDGFNPLVADPERDRGSDDEPEGRPEGDAEDKELIAVSGVTRFDGRLPSLLHADHWSRSRPQLL